MINRMYCSMDKNLQMQISSRFKALNYVVDGNQLLKKLYFMFIISQTFACELFLIHNSIYFNRIIHTQIKTHSSRWHSAQSILNTVLKMFYCIQQQQKRIQSTFCKCLQLFKPLLSVFPKAEGQNSGKMKVLCLCKILFLPLSLSPLDILYLISLRIHLLH